MNSKAPKTPKPRSGEDPLLQQTAQPRETQLVSAALQFLTPPESQDSGVGFYLWKARIQSNRDRAERVTLAISVTYFVAFVVAGTLLLLLLQGPLVSQFRVWLTTLYSGAPEILTYLLLPLVLATVLSRLLRLEEK